MNSSAVCLLEREEELRPDKRRRRQHAPSTSWYEKRNLHLLIDFILMKTLRSFLCYNYCLPSSVICLSERGEETRRKQVQAKTRSRPDQDQDQMRREMSRGGSVHCEASHLKRWIHIYSLMLQLYFMPLLKFWAVIPSHLPSLSSLSSCLRRERCVYFMFMWCCRSEYTDKSFINVLTVLLKFWTVIPSCLSLSISREDERLQMSPHLQQHRTQSVVLDIVLSVFTHRSSWTPGLQKGHSSMCQLWHVLQWMLGHPQRVL